jgi:predicted nucleic acid-binding protein
MIYLDTNVLLYATLSEVDTPHQQEQAIEILKELIDSDTLLLSNLNLLEYAFVMKKAKEESSKIQSALELFQTFVKDEHEGFNLQLMNMLTDDYAYKNSFDLYHVAFACHHQCKKLLTFDKGFKKFRDLCEIEIDILYVV